MATKKAVKKATTKKAEKKQCYDVVDAADVIVGFVELTQAEAKQMSAALRKDGAHQRLVLDKNSEPAVEKIAS